MSTASLEEALFQFLKQNYELSKPVLLGLSGGPDSLLLFQLLIKIQSFFPIKLGIAHIDHGWRIESQDEAKILAELANRHTIPFHLKKINPLELKGNLEAECRTARYKFFAEICHHYHYQAVLLGHHAGDFIETVFKRILEGVSLPYLYGIQEVTKFKDLNIWRPFLPFQKKQILATLQEYNLTPFEDITNSNLKFLRARLRSQIFPQLTLDFGKQIETSLEHIGQESKELKDYLEFKLQSELQNIEKSPLGYYLNTNNKAFHSYEIKFLIKKICESADFFLSRDFLKKTIYLLQSRAANKEIIMGSHRLYIDRGHLFLILKKPGLSNQRYEIKMGEFEYGSWHVKVEFAEDITAFPPSTWKEVWKGKCEIFIPEGGYELGPVELGANYPGHSPISKWWTNAKVPALFRHFVPVIWFKNEIFAEFLLGSKRIVPKISSSGWKVQIHLI